MKTMVRILFPLLMLSTALYPQVAGDYGSAASGNWGTAATWVVCVTNGTWTGATVAAASPNATKNVFIRTGHSVVLDASGKTCLNLTIDSGGVLYNNTPTTTNRYLRISGSTATINGTFGGEADGIGIEPYASVTFTGTGTFRPCRIRTGSSISNITVTFDINTTFTYTGSSGTGGAGLYSFNSGNDNITFTINAGKTVTAVNYCNIATSSSTSVDGGANTIFNINGTLSLPGPNSNMSLRTATGKTCELNISGLVEVGNNFLPTSFTTANSTAITVNAGGELKVGTGGGGTCDVDSAIVNGAGKFTLASGSTITIGSPTGLEPVAGSIRTTTRSFSTGAKYSYVGTAAQVTGADLPSNVHTMTVNNAAGVTLTNDVAVDTNLVFTNGKLVTGVKRVTAKGAITAAGAGKFVEGNLSIPVSAAGVASWQLGQNTDYLPFIARFGSVTGTDNVEVKVLDKTSTAPLGSYIADNKVLKRYFRILKGAGITAFTTDSVVVTYTNADAAEQGVTDENTLRVYKHDGAALTAVNIAARDTAANTITVTGVNSFSDFIVTGAEIVIPGSSSVTFQVNMKVQSRIKKFDPAKDTVIVRGDFYQGVGNWWEANDLKLTDGDGDSIYTGTFNVGPVPKRLAKYKFVKRGPSFVGDVWEVDMGTNKDRTDTIPSSPWTLPVVWFDYDSTSNQILVPPVLPLTFEASNVDYAFSNFSGATTTRIANPNSSGINTSGYVGKTIKGAGDPWAGSYITLSAPVDFSKGKIFKAKVFMPKVGAKMLFKLEHLTTGSINKELDAVGTKANEWEELTWDFSTIDATKEYQKVVIIFDLGTSGDGGPNFTYLFDDIVQVAPASGVTFQVNMKVQAKLKKFNPAKDTVLLRGDFYQGAGNWWEANDQKLTDADGDSIYVGTFPVGTAPKRLGKFKFVLRGPDVAGDRWELDMGVNKDRTDTIPSLPWTLPVVWFNNDSTSQYSDNFITFQVNMKKQMRNSAFDKTKDSVVVRGDFNGWGGNTHVLADANVDSVYTGTFNIQSTKKIIYKFVIHRSSGDTWEGSSDRIDSLLNGTPRTEPVVWFGNDSILTGVRRDVHAVVTQYELLQNYPNPFNPATTIAFSILKEGWVTLKIFNVVGQEVETIVNQHLAAGMHIATFNALHLTSGVYFYKLEAGSFTSIKKMMLLK